MASDAPTPRTAHLNWLMTRLVQRVPLTHGAVLLSSDGLVKAAHGLDADDADHLAAVASGLCSLGRWAGVRFAAGSEVRRVVVELDTALLTCCPAGTGGCLAVLASPAADAAALDREIAALVMSVRPQTALAPTSPPAPPSHPSPSPAPSPSTAQNRPGSRPPTPTVPRRAAGHPAPSPLVAQPRA